MSLSPNFEKVINSHWKKLKANARHYQQRQNKNKNKIINREAEELAIAQFIATNGVTKIDINIETGVDQFQSRTLSVVPAWKE